MHDDLGRRVDIPQPARRVVSLVPSLTEAIAATRPEALVGATDWCTHPANLDVTRVRGTKNPNRRTIAELNPDVVIANQEENRRLDVERLEAAGIAVWVTRIETVDQAFGAMRRMFDSALGWPIPKWLVDAETAWTPAQRTAPKDVAIAIWRDPWMVIGSKNYTTDLVARLGWRNVFAEHPDRYPRVALTDLDRDHGTAVVLPDEPYEFSATDGPEAFQRAKTVLVSGRLLTWYGPAMLEARATLESLKL